MKVVLTYTGMVTGIHGVFGEAPYNTTILLDDTVWLFRIFPPGI